MLAESGAKLRRITHRERLDHFGSFRFRHRPVPGNYENIEITDRWESANIIPIEVPAVARLRGASRTFNAGVSVFQCLGGAKGSAHRPGSFSYLLPKHRNTGPRPTGFLISPTDH